MVPPGRPENRSPRQKPQVNRANFSVSGCGSSAVARGLALARSQKHHGVHSPRGGVSLGSPAPRSPPGEERPSAPKGARTGSEQKREGETPGGRGRAVGPARSVSQSRRRPLVRLHARGQKRVLFRTAWPGRTSPPSRGSGPRGPAGASGKRSRSRGPAAARGLPSGARAGLYFYTVVRMGVSFTFCYKQCDLDQSQRKKNKIIITTAKPPSANMIRLPLEVSLSCPRAASERAGEP